VNGWEFSGRFISFDHELRRSNKGWFKCFFGCFKHQKVEGVLSVFCENINGLIAVGRSHDILIFWWYSIW
jgi:hypothetical protein